MSAPSLSSPYPAHLPKVDHDAVIALMREAAETLILPRFDALEQGEIREKGPGDLVTVADLEAEHFLTPRLADLLPGSVVVGEEAHSKTPEIRSRFDDDAPVWLIDPVDGTKNFANANPNFCTMVALTRGNQPIMGWIHDALKNKTFSAELGAGAYRDGSRVTLPAPPQDEGQWVAQMDRRYFDKAQRDERAAAARSRFGEISSLGCAGQDFIAQLEGRRQFAFYNRLWPWDHAPGVLIHREAGGMSTRIDGTPYRAGDCTHGLLVAPSETHWHDLRAFLGGGGDV